MRVVLDGQIYALKAGTGVTRVALTEYQQNVRLQGQQTRSDRSNLSSIVYDRWDGGLGVYQRNYSDSRTMNRIWNANYVDTRWSALMVSPKFIVASVDPPIDASIPIEYLGNLYFLERGLTATKPYLLGMAYKYAAPVTIASLTGLAGTGAADYRLDLRAARAFGGKIGVVYRDMAANTMKFSHVATLGGSLNTTNMELGITSAVATLDPEIGDFGGTPHVMAYDQVNGHVTMAISNQWFGSAAGVATIPQSIGSYLAPLVTDGLTMWANLADGVYEFDTVPHKVIDTSQSRDINPWQTLFRNYLHFKNHYSLMKYDGDEITPVGYDQFDGLPSDKWGQITAGVSSQQFMFAAVKGPNYSHILAYNGAAWHYYAVIPTPGLTVKKLFLSNLGGDNVDKLWCVFNPGTYAPGYFINPLTDPRLAGTYSHEMVIGSSFSNVTFPLDDGGIPEQSGGFYNAIVSGVNIGIFKATTLLYGIDGVAPVGTIGTFTADGETKTINDPVGTVGNKIWIKAALHNQPNGGTPELRSIIVNYLKIPNSRESFDFTIDIDETARAEVKPTEAVIGSLNYLRSKRSLSPFFYGAMGTKNVLMMDVPAAEDVDKEQEFLGERSGFVRVRCAEII